MKNLLILLGIILTIDMSYAAEKNLNDNKKITEFLGQDVVKTKNLKEASEKNKITKPVKKLKVKEFLKENGFDITKVKVIETYGFMRYTVVRIQVSPLYDIVLELGLEPGPKEEDDRDIVFNGFVVNHSNEKYGHKFLDKKRWDQIILN